MLVQAASIKPQNTLVPPDFDLEYYQRNIVPQPGPQTEAHASSADIGVYGGAAGGGKSRFLIAEPTRHINNPFFRGVIFRQSSPQILGPNGLWEESRHVYPKVKGVPKISAPTEWHFPSGAVIMFRHLENEEQALLDWQGLAASYYGFDEVTQISERLFFYIALSRARSTSGVVPYVRCTCNPDPYSWLRDFLKPWLDFPFQGPGGSARPGELRYFRRVDDDHVWYTEPQYSPDGRVLTKSVTFIASSVYDNKVLLSVNPEYLTGLENLGYVDKERLLHGNWSVQESGNMFKRKWLEKNKLTLEQFVEKYKDRYLSICRFWDLAAATPKPNNMNPDFTSGGLMAHDAEDDVYIMLDLEAFQGNPGEVRERIKAVAKEDLTRWNRFGNIHVRMEQEPGASGLTVVDDYKNLHMTDYDFDYIKPTGSKVERAKPLSADMYKGRVYILEGEWNDVWYKYSSPFPRKGIKDDPVDCMSGAHTALTEIDEDSVCPVSPSERIASLRK